jgi:hypothetical protein
MAVPAEDMLREGWPLGAHDLMGKHLMSVALGSLFTESGPSVKIDFGLGAGEARIDGTVAGAVAVDIESRTPRRPDGSRAALVS